MALLKSVKKTTLKGLDGRLSKLYEDLSVETKGLKFGTVSPGIKV